MLRIQTDLRAYAISAGEPWLMEVQLLDQNSQALDIPDDALVLTFYDAGTRAIVDQTIGERRQDSTGEYFRWARAGTFTEGLYGKALKVELARRYKDSRLVISTGDLTISSTAASVPSLSTAPIGDIITRVSIKASAQLGGTAAVTIGVRPFEEAPEFAELPAIAHDGTPIAGDTGTLTWGTISGGSSLLREVLLNGTALDGPIGGTITFQVGTYQLRETAEGPGGQSIGRSEAVVVQPAPPKPTIAFGTLDLVKLEGNTGTAIFSAPITLARDGSTAALGYTWQVVASGSSPADATDFGGTFPSDSGTFDPGQTAKTITFLVSGDAAIEPDESFRLEVTLTGYNSISANGTITNDDFAPATLTYGSTQVGSGMGLMTRDDGTNLVLPANSAEGSGSSDAGGLWYGYVTGSDVALTMLSSFGNTANEIVRWAVDEGAFVNSTYVAGKYQLLTGAASQRRLLQLRMHPSYGDNSRMPKAGFLTVTGAPPSVEVPAGRRLCGTTGVPYLTFTKATDKTDFPPARIPETNVNTTGANPSSTVVIARGTRLAIESTARILWYAKSGGSPVKIDRGGRGARVSIIDVEQGATYHVWTGDRGTLAVAGFGATPEVAALPWLVAVGDSFIEGAPIGDVGAVDTFIVAAKMGRLGGNFGLGGETSVGGAARLPGVLANLGTPPAGSVLVLAWGQNDASPSAAQRKAAYKTVAQAGVDAGYALVLLRGTIDAPPVGLSVSNQPMIDAVSELANAKVKYIDPSTWTSIDRISDGHPSSLPTGYAKLAVYAETSYRAAGA